MPGKIYLHFQELTVWPESGMSVFWREMKQGRGPLFILYFCELLNKIPGVLCRHFSIVFPLKTGEIGSWYRKKSIKIHPIGRSDEKAYDTNESYLRKLEVLNDLSFHQVLVARYIIRPLHSDLTWMVHLLWRRVLVTECWPKFKLWFFYGTAAGLSEKFKITSLSRSFFFNGLLAESQATTGKRVVQKIRAVEPSSCVGVANGFVVANKVVFNSVHGGCYNVKPSGYFSHCPSQETGGWFTWSLHDLLLFLGNDYKQNLKLKVHKIIISQLGDYFS